MERSCGVEINTRGSQKGSKVLGGVDPDHGPWESSHDLGLGTFLGSIVVREGMTQNIRGK